MSRSPTEIIVCFQVSLKWPNIFRYRKVCQSKCFFAQFVLLLFVRSLVQHFGEWAGPAFTVFSQFCHVRKMEQRRDSGTNKWIRLVRRLIGQLPHQYACKCFPQMIFPRFEKTQCILETPTLTVPYKYPSKRSEGRLPKIGAFCTYWPCSNIRSRVCWFWAMLALDVRHLWQGCVRRTAKARSSLGNIIFRHIHPQAARVTLSH